MKKATRFLPLLLCAVLLFGLVPTPSLALDESAVTRYTVLVLDTSNSASFSSGGVQIYNADTALPYVKEAAKSFFSSLINADGTNYVAVVSYHSTAAIVSDFSTDVNVLSAKVARLTEYDDVRDISEGLRIANDLLSDIADGKNIRKNVVLITTGMTNGGEYSYDGLYSADTVGSEWYRISTDIHLYAYANHAISVAGELKNQATVYTVGLFQTLEGMPDRGKDVVELFKLTAGDLATSKDYFFQVEDPSELTFTFGDVAESITSPVIESRFQWAGSFRSDRDQVGTCYYTDDYFLESSLRNNPQLRTMSLALELTAWSSNESGDDGWTADESAASAKWQNARTLLCGIDGDDNYPGLGFSAESFTVSEDWENPPEKDSIGLIAASKTLVNGSTLVVLAVRGGGYEQEWASNLTVGLEGDHAGFAKGRDDALAFLDTYFQTNGITGPIKLWIVGYSRAGAVANMVGGALDSGYSFAADVTVAYDDLFVYAFEPPQGVIRENASGYFSNIHNIVNANDLVPMVAPTAWDFTRYNANDFWIPSGAGTARYQTYYPIMLRQLNEMDGIHDFLLGYEAEGKIREHKSTDAETAYIIPETVLQYRTQINWQNILPFGGPLIEQIPVSVSTQDALNRTIDFLATGVLGSRSVYYSDWQAGVREILALLNGGSLSDLAKEGITPEDFINRFFSKLTFERICEILAPAFSLNPFYPLNERMDDIRKNIGDFVADVLGNTDLWGAVHWAVGLGDSIADLLMRLLGAVAEDCLAHNGAALQSVGNVLALGLDNNLGDFFVGLFEPHAPEITLAWMMATDSNYPGGVDEEGSNQFTRVIHINCPVDIRVYDSRDSLVAAIAADEPREIDGAAIPAFVNLDGEKVVMLPADDSYRMEIEATDEGEVHVSIREFFFGSASANRLLQYSAIPVSRGDILTASIPQAEESERLLASAEGSTVNYEILDKNGRVIEPSFQSAGLDAQETYDVSVGVDGENGFVTGGGRYPEGSFARVQAYPINGASFLGWYVDGSRVSEEEIYRFPVTQNTDVTAKFSAVETYTLTFETTSGGQVKNVDLVLPAGTQVSVAAVADPGCVFRTWEATGGNFENASEPETRFTMPAEDVTVTAVFDDPSAPPAERRPAWKTFFLLCVAIWGVLTNPDITSFLALLTSVFRSLL